MIEQRLCELNIDLPTPTAAIANYVPFYRNNGWVIISGQLPLQNGQLVYKGHIGKELNLEQGQEAARLCAINLLAHLKVACAGNWNQVISCARLGGFVACSSEFTDHPKVLNGASDLIVDVLGDIGRHARCAVGVTSLPLGAAVEVEAIFRLHSTNPDIT